MFRFAMPLAVTVLVALTGSSLAQSPVELEFARLRARNQGWNQGGQGGWNQGGFPGGAPGWGMGGGGGFGGQAGVTGPARMVPDRAHQHTNITGSGVLRGPLTIITQFGGAGGIGGQNFAGGGGNFGGLGGFAPGGAGVGGLHPPGVSLNQAYNTLVGLPAQQGMLGGGFGLGGGGFGGGFLGFGGGFPGFGGGFGFGAVPGVSPFGGGFPAKLGGFGNGGHGL